jgi:lipopolysaccharide biosynthesis glycosyltransferase
MDADMMVQGDLRELIEVSNPRAFFTSDYSNLKESTTNYPELYTLLPLNRKSLDMKPYLNTGLYVLNKKRDAHIISSWQYCVSRAFENKEIASKISCWDQGACKWALHQNDSLFLIAPDKKFNHPAKVRHYSYPASSRIIPFWIESLKENCVVMHWMGGPKPWDNWGEMLNLDLSSKFK